MEGLINLDEKMMQQMQRNPQAYLYPITVMYRVMQQLQKSMNPQMVAL